MNLLGRNGLFPLVSVREGLVSTGFWWEGLVSAGFGSFQVVSAGFESFRFLVITLMQVSYDVEFYMLGAGLLQCGFC